MPPADTSMPPSDRTPTPDAGAAPGDVAAAAPNAEGSAGDGGSVMIQVPKALFDQVHQIAVSLAQTLDEAMGAVNQQKGAMEGPAAPQMPPEAPAEPSAPAAGPSPDEQDLENFAQELNQRGQR